MKNQVSNQVKNNNLLKAAALAVVLMANTFSASAFDRKLKTAKPTIAPIEVTYLGQINNQPIFQMNIDNAFEDVLYVTLRDEEGNVLYGETFTDKKISKKFQFHNQGEAKDLNVTVNLSTKSNRIVQTYRISNVSRVVRDVVVTEVK